jgi:hypothetical protein
MLDQLRTSTSSEATPGPHTDPGPEPATVAALTGGLLYVLVTAFSHEDRVGPVRGWQPKTSVVAGAVTLRYPSRGDVCTIQRGPDGDFWLLGWDATVVPGDVVTAPTGGTAPDATATAKGVVQLAGDLAGTAAAPVLSAAKDAQVKSRANHTGTQVAATVSDFDMQVRTSRLDQLAVPSAPVALGAQRLTGVLDPTGPQDASTKNYVDNVVATGIAWKQPARAASTVNVTLTAPGTTLDGVTLSVNDRVLLKNQTTATENGIYVWTASGSTLTRASDSTTAANLVGATVLVTRGSVGADTVWTQTADPVTVGTTSIAWTQIQSATQIQGDGVTTSRTSNLIGTIRPVAPAVPANGAVAVGTLGVARIIPFALVGNGTVASFAVSHGLASTMCAVQVFDSTGSKVEVDVTLTSSSVVTLAFAVAPAAGVTYTGVVVG